MSSSQMFAIMKKAGMTIELVALKQLLNELGFPFNGPSCSLTALMTSCKAFLQGSMSRSNGFAIGAEGNAETNVTTPRPVMTSEWSGAAQRTCDLLRDVIYTNKKPLIEIFKLGITSLGSGKTVDREGFQRIVNELGVS